MPKPSLVQRTRFVNAAKRAKTGLEALMPKVATSTMAGLMNIAKPRRTMRRVMRRKSKGC